MSAQTSRTTRKGKYQSFSQSIHNVSFLLALALVVVVGNLNLNFWNEHRNIIKCSPTYPATGPLILSRNSKESNLKEMDGKVTIVIMTYRRVDELLKNPLMHDIIPLDIVAELIIIWNDTEDKSQISLVRETFDRWGLSHKLRFFLPTHNSLNNRFIPLPNITTKALYSTDDEWTTSAENFQQAFRWWQQNPHRLVGFTPRRLETSKYISFPDFGYLPAVKKTQYNTLLPGGGLFFHVDFLHGYAEQTPNKIEARQHVDKIFNCEDILFNFMVPKEFHPPLLVAINYTETQYYTHRTDGISNSRGHWATRQHCVKLFQKLLGWPFVNTHTIATQRLPTHFKNSVGNSNN
mmetsp:Transcript_16098/g.29172  ORF Transcript_16098/g.29172 Transcript_16098/m.29172 type:complete len:349 (+) Transcript_16098:197-1243(+)